MMIRAYIFLCGLFVIAIGIFAKRELPEEGVSFLLGALTLGGAFLICGGFSIRMKWHGVIGAGVVALLGFSRGMLNLSHLAAYVTGDQSRGIAPVLEFVIAIICAFLLLRIFKAWQQQRAKNLLEEGEGTKPPTDH